jgi:hypothetical protein
MVVIRINKRVSFICDVQESLKLLDNKPTVIININQEILIMMCQTEPGLRQITHISKNVGSRTLSKMQNVNVNNLRVQNLFFPLHDAILFQGCEMFQAQNLQLGVLKCKVYHNVSLITKPQVDFDHLHQLYMLGNTEDDKDKS